MAAEIDEIIQWCKSAGLDEYIEFNNDCFQAHKERLGIEFAYPANDPDSSYHSLTITSVYGDTSYYKEIPENMKNADL